MQKLSKKMPGKLTDHGTEVRRGGQPDTHYEQEKMPPAYRAERDARIQAHGKRIHDELKRLGRDHGRLNWSI